MSPRSGGRTPKMEFGMHKAGWWIRSKLAGACVAFLALGAGAAELSLEKLEQSTDVQGCAQHGPGYVRVEGTDACARIRSRMRVEMNVTRAPPFLGGAPLFEAPAPFDPMPGDGPSRAYLRLEQPGRPAERQISR